MQRTTFRKLKLIHAATDVEDLRSQPGDVLMEDFIGDFTIMQNKLAVATRVPTRTIAHRPRCEGLTVRRLVAKSRRRHSAGPERKPVPEC